MVNINGQLYSNNHAFISVENRGYKYGDALFETIKYVNSELLFWEDHYFRLMASMRIIRMEIPMNFTMEFLETEILKTIEANNFLELTVRVRLNVDRGNNGKYLPKKLNTTSYNIVVEIDSSTLYSINKKMPYVVDLYKDYLIAPSILATLKSNNKALQVVGSIYAKENGLDNCLVLNTNKTIVEALNGNLFLVKGENVKTPPIEDGCLKGIMRKQILGLLATDVNIHIEETAISPFEIQKADELFITNVIQGIIPVTRYRKKVFSTEFSEKILTKLNIKFGLVD